MEFNLKKENRKKFQDKSKLKRHHKKDYSKVVPKDSSSVEQTLQPEEVETEYEDVSEPELDDKGDFILREGEIEDINEDGVKVVRRKKIDKVNSNAWRYRDEVEIAGLDQDEEELIKSIDFKKLDFGTIDSKQDKHKDYKRMTKDELQKLKIVDSRFDKADSLGNKEDDELEDRFNFTKQPEAKTNQATPPPPSSSKTPSALRSDEAFLDDLL